MFRTLFDLAGIALVGWVLLIFLPTWKVARRIAESAVFPLFLAVLYVIGIGAVLREFGPGIVADFGSAEGVVSLLRLEPVSLVAWIHLLAFDQIVGILIYRDNMRGRYISVPLQSVVLAATLVLGPLGFLGYWALRTARRRDPRMAWGDRDPDASVASARPSPPVEAPRFQAVVTGASPLGQVIGLWRRHPVVPVLGLIGFAFAAATSAVAAVHGDWLLEPEGRLLEAVKFDVAVGIFMLTLGLIVPLAPMTAAGRRRWTGWMAVLAAYFYLMENVQAWRGLDPRFSDVAGPADQVLGGLFFFSALGILALFVILMLRFFRRDALPDHPALRLALRYGTGAALIAFGVGILMSAVQGRAMGARGDLMLVHAAGFHGLQAVPAIALLLGAAAPVGKALRLTGVGGMGWLLICGGMVVQAALGRAPLAATPALGLSAIGALIWAAALVLAVRAWGQSRVHRLAGS